LGGIAPSVDSHAQVGVKRHPTLGNGVIVGSGAQILGPITVGFEARIGANSVVSKDIASSVTAVGIPARVIMPKDKSRAGEFQAYGEPSDGCPDLVLNTIEDLRRQITVLASRVKELEASNATSDATESKWAGRA
jgi:serine O-acetyltransferase